MIESLLEVHDTRGMGPGNTLFMHGKYIEIVCVARPGLLVVKPYIPSKKKTFFHCLGRLISFVKSEIPFGRGH